MEPLVVEQDATEGSEYFSPRSEFTVAAFDLASGESKAAIATKVLDEASAEVLRAELRRGRASCCLEACRPFGVDPSPVCAESQAIFEVATRTGEVAVLACRLPRGMHEVKLERVNKWYRGYQAASVLIARNASEGESVVELDSGRANRGTFSVWTDFVYIFIFVYHHCTGGARSSGLARLTLARQELPSSTAQFSVADKPAHVPLPEVEAKVLWQKLLQVASTGRSLTDADAALNELCQQYNLRPEKTGDSSSVEIDTRSAQTDVIAFKISQGLHDIRLERLNSWYLGYQTASVLMTRRGLDDCLVVELDSGRAGQMKCAALEGYEYLFIFVVHCYTGRGASTGTARVTLIREELPETIFE